jgi:hypothetical protein
MGYSCRKGPSKKDLRKMEKEAEKERKKQERLAELEAAKAAEESNVCRLEWRSGELRDACWLLIGRETSVKPCWTYWWR